MVSSPMASRQSCHLARNSANLARPHLSLLRLKIRACVKIHLTQDLPKEIYILHRPELAAPGKGSLFSCNIHFQISWASSWQYVSHLVPPDIPSCSELHLYLFKVSRISRTGQNLLLEFSMDGPADNRGKVTDGG